MKRDAGEVEDMEEDDDDLVHPCARCIIVMSMQTQSRDNPILYSIYDIYCSIVTTFITLYLHPCARVYQPPL